MKILRISDIANNRTGGMSRYIHEVSDILLKNGHEVQLVFSNDIPCKNSSKWRRFLAPIAVVKMVLSLLKAGNKFAVVEIHEPLAAGYALARLFMRKLPPLLVSVYAIEGRALQTKVSYAKMKGISLNLLSRLKPLTIVWQANFALKHAQHIIVETQDDVQFLHKHLRIKNSISIQHGGVDRNIFIYKNDLPQGILFLGSWIERKGIIDFIETIEWLFKNEIVIPVTIAGTGCPEDEVREMFSFPLRSHIRVISKVTTNEDLVSIYHSHSIFLFPSTLEGLPLVLLEAASCGLAIVTTNTSGMKDFIDHGVNGLLSEVGDTQALIQNVKLLLTDIGYQNLLGFKASEKAKLYSWENSAHQFLDACNKTVNVE